MAVFRLTDNASDRVRPFVTRLSKDLKSMKTKSILTLGTLAAAALIVAGSHAAKAAEITTDTTAATGSATAPVKQQAAHVKHKLKHVSKETKVKAEAGKTDAEAKTSTDIK